MENNEKKSTLFERNFILVAIAALLTGVCMRMLDSNLAPFANSAWGSKTLGGFLTTTFNAGSILMAFFSGRLVDANGRKKCFIAATFLFGAATLLCVFFPTPAVTLTVRFIQGVAKGLFSVASASVVADVVPRDRMSEGMGLYGLGNTLAMAFGPMLALAITADGNYTRMFLICAILYSSAGVMGFGFNYEKKRGKDTEKVIEDPSSDQTQYKGIWKLIEKKALLPALNFTIFFGSTAAILVYLTVYAQESLELPSTRISLFFTIAAITMLIARFTIGKLADRKGALSVLVPCHLLTIVMYLILIFFAGKSYVMYLVAGGVYGFSTAMVMPVLNAVAVVDSPKERSGAANASFYFLNDFGILIASAAYGPIIDAAKTPTEGYHKIFYISIAVCLISCIMCIVFFNEKARERRRAE